MDEHTVVTGKRPRGRPRKEREVDEVAMLRKNKGCYITLSGSAPSMDDAEKMLQQLRDNFAVPPPVDYPLIDTLRLDVKVNVEATNIFLNPASAEGHDPNLPEVKLPDGQITLHKREQYDCIWWATETENLLVGGSAVVRLGIALNTDEEKRDRALVVFEVNARNARLGILPPVELAETGKRSCPVCGKPFVPKRSDQVYDSQKCADTAGARRRRREQKTRRIAISKE